jgi:hypothetical protein
MRWHTATAFAGELRQSEPRRPGGTLTAIKKRPSILTVARNIAAPTGKGNRLHLRQPA